MSHRIGILSDTHLTSCSTSYRRQVDLAFGDCDAIIHAGDLTSLAVLEPFRGKPLVAVHGNMCDTAARTALPESRILALDGISVAVCHGNGPRHTIEERLFERFPEADCIVYGHTHQPVLHRCGGILYLNPGSFQGTGPYGSPGTYAILHITQKKLTADLYELPSLS